MLLVMSLEVHQSRRGCRALAESLDLRVRHNEFGLSAGSLHLAPLGGEVEIRAANFG